MATDQTFDQGSAAHATSALSEQVQCDLDAIFHNWCYLAALAWEGYVTAGRGTIIVDVGAEEAGVTYCGGTMAGRAAYVECYDPRREVVLVVRHPHGEETYWLPGHPSPPECFEEASAEAMNASVH